MDVKKQRPHRVILYLTVKNNQQYVDVSDQLSWLMNNSEYDWSYVPYWNETHFFFETTEDAIAFKLRWTR